MPSLIDIDMNRQSLDTYAPCSESKAAYLAENGWHFSKAACAKAVKGVYRDYRKTAAEKMEPWSLEEVEEMFKKYGIDLENAAGYDHVYLANKIRVMHLKRAIADEHHLCMYLKECIDGPGASDGVIFREWYAAMIDKGNPVQWADIL